MFGEPTLIQADAATDWGPEVETIVGPIRVRQVDQYIEILIVATDIEARYPCSEAWSDGPPLALELCAGQCHIRRDDMPTINLFGFADEAG